MATKIEWTEKVWNTVTGCTKVSEACQNCYAEVMAKRLSGMPASKEKYKNGFKVTLHPECLEEPFSWKKPTMCFVVSMGDLFHKHVSVEFLDKVFDVIENTPQHTYQVLTKRTMRMAWFSQNTDISLRMSGLVLPVRMGNTTTVFAICEVSKMLPSASYPANRCLVIWQI